MEMNEKLSEYQISPRDPMNLLQTYKVYHL